MARETARAAEDEGAGPPDRSAALEDSATAASALAAEIGEIVEIVEIVEAQEDGSDETLAESGTFAPPAIAFAPAASAMADLARDPPETAAPAPVEPGRITAASRDGERAAVEPVDEPVDEPTDEAAIRSAAGEPPGPATASMAAPALAPDPTGDAADRTADRVAGRDTTRPPRRPAPAAMPDPPRWLPRALWDRWQAHRRALKKPVTADGARLTFAQLEKAKGFGHDPVELLETAIANGWQGCVFPDKHYQPAAVRPTSGPPRAGARRSLREVPADPAVYLKTAGFETELEAS